MSLSSYPFGFKNGIGLQGLPLTTAVSNTVVWVDSNHGNDGNNGSVATPYKSIQGAINGLNNYSSTSGQRIGNTLNGCLIMLKPYHAESLAAATTYTLAAVSIIGVHSGDDDMPTITLTTAAGAGVVLNGNAMNISNVKFVSNFAVNACLKLSALGQTVDSCKFQDGTASYTSGISVLNGTSNGADRFCIQNCYFESGGATQGIFLSEIEDKGVIDSNNFIGAFSAAGIQNTTAVLTNLSIAYNNTAITVSGTNATPIVMVSTTTGMFVGNLTAGKGTPVNAHAGMFSAGNYIAGTAS